MIFDNRYDRPSEEWRAIFDKEGCRLVPFWLKKAKATQVVTLEQTDLLLRLLAAWRDETEYESYRASVPPMAPDDPPWHTYDNEDDNDDE